MERPPRQYFGGFFPSNTGPAWAEGSAVLNLWPFGAGSACSVGSGCDVRGGRPRLRPVLGVFACLKFDSSLKPGRRSHPSRIPQVREAIPPLRCSTSEYRKAPGPQPGAFLVFSLIQGGGGEPVRVFPCIGFFSPPIILVRGVIPGAPPRLGSPLGL